MRPTVVELKSDRSGPRPLDQRDTLWGLEVSTTHRFPPKFSVSNTAKQCVVTFTYVFTQTTRTPLGEPSGSRRKQEPRVKGLWGSESCGPLGGGRGTEIRTADEIKEIIREFMDEVITRNTVSPDERSPLFFYLNSRVYVRGSVSTFVTRLTRVSYGRERLQQLTPKNQSLFREGNS